MNGEQVLVAHHEILRGLLSDLRRSDPATPARRRELVSQLMTELEIHVAIEDDVFYPAVAAVSPLVGVAHAQHRLIADQLAVVLRTDPAGPDFDREVAALQHAVEEHAGEEEREMFPQSQALGDQQLEDLGERMRRKQTRLRASTVHPVAHPGEAGDAPPSLVPVGMTRRCQPSRVG